MNVVHRSSLVCLQLPCAQAAAMGTVHGAPSELSAVSCRQGLPYVINMTLPDRSEDYIHR